MPQHSPHFFDGKGGQFFDELDAVLIEEEEALARSREFLEGLSIEDGEVALYGLTQQLHDAEHPIVEDMVMGWERSVMDATTSDQHPDHLSEPEPSSDVLL